VYDAPNRAFVRSIGEASHPRLRRAQARERGSGRTISQPDGPPGASPRAPRRQAPPR